MQNLVVRVRGLKVFKETVVMKACIGMLVAIIALGSCMRRDPHEKILWNEDAKNRYYFVPERTIELSGKVSSWQNLDIISLGEFHQEDPPWFSPAVTILILYARDSAMREKIASIKESNFIIVKGSRGYELIEDKLKGSLKRCGAAQNTAKVLVDTLAIRTPGGTNFRP